MTVTAFSPETNQLTLQEMSTLDEEVDLHIPRAPLSPVVEMPPEYPDDEESATLLPCSTCSRTFTQSALQRHSKVCEKLQAKKRNKFDSTKQRQDGLDISPLKLGSRDNTKKEEKKKSRWREKHQEFLRTIRAAKGSPDGSGEDGEGGQQRLIPSDYVKCPHCERHFGPKAADRHISWCGEQKSRLPRSHTTEDNEAIHRLKTRTKYVPPKPGQNGWRAPKKKDVISSIPPANAGPNPTPPGRLVSPPPPVQRQISPPPMARQHSIQRHLSPPPMSPSRKTSPSSSLPPGPHRYSTASLGRSVGKQFSAMLQSVTGCSPTYGTSTGYGSHSLYGSSPNHGHMPFNRSASLRLPRRRSGAHGRMARHRDLASDMLASVTLGGKAKREEPEGDEASNMTPFYDRSPSNKNENERLNNEQQREEYRNSSSPRIIRSNTFEIANRHDYFHEILDSSEEDENLPLEKVKSKREALDKEILRLTQQLRISKESNAARKYEQKTSLKEDQENIDDSPENGSGNNHGALNEFNFHYSDSDEELDCNIEETFLKSSASLSGDDDVVDMTPSRPRSVHFEDECRESGYFEVDENKSSSENSNPQSAGSQRTWCQIERREPQENKTDIWLFNSRPINSKKTKESVREILRKRREMMDQSEHDSRRRVRSLDEKTDNRTRSNSHSRDSKPTRTHYREPIKREEPSSMRKSVSTGNCSENYLVQRQISFPLSSSSNSSCHVNEVLGEGAVISRKDYDHFRSLIGNRKTGNNPNKRKKRPILNPKKIEKATKARPRLDNAPYDPFSAAELQFQDLLGPAKPGGSLRSEMMGSTSSLKHIGRPRRFSPERDIFHGRPKVRSSSLMGGGGSLSLCSLGLDSFDFASCIRPPREDDSSELESLEDSPRDLRSPDDRMDDVVSRFSSSSRVIDPFHSNASNSNYKHSVGGHLQSESRFRHSRSPSLSSQSARSVIEDSNKRKHPEGGPNSMQKSPSPPFSFRFDSSERKSPAKERSPSPQIVRRLSPSFKKHEGDIENSNVSPYSGWANHSDQPGSPKIYSRYLTVKNQRESPSDVSSQAYSSAFESIKALRASLGDDKKTPAESLEIKHQRVSSSSSTDSSLLALSSPTSVSPVRREAKPQISTQSSLPTFCYECGNKYPVVVAKFCCHCGARRLVIAE